jgi:hypothetical protein
MNNDGICFPHFLGFCITEQDIGVKSLFLTLMVASETAGPVESKPYPRWEKSNTTESTDGSHFVKCIVLERPDAINE